MGDKSPGTRTPLYKETNIVPNDCYRICRIYVKISGQSKINVFGYNNKDFSQTLSSVLSAVCQREVVKFARVYQSRLLHCLLLRGAPFASIRGHSLQNSNINMYSGNLARILVWRLHFLFCGTTALGRVMQHNKPLRFGMYFQRFLLTQCQK